MKTIQLLILLWIIAINISAQYIMKEEYITVYPSEKIQRSFTYKNLRLYPLIGGDNFKQAHKELSDYSNLEEALKSKKVEITETNNSSGEVNTLSIENLSNDTIYIMAGEVIKGGKQDRVISDDFMLLPKSGKIDLSVFCVEHNRWSYKSDRENFDTYYTVSSNAVRKNASVEKDQGKVWSEVAKITENNDAATRTGTYTALENSQKYKNELNAYLKYFENAFIEINDCIGFVGVTGDKVIGCDIFATETLLNKQLKNLLNAYITEAITTGSEVDIKDQTVMNYLKEFLSEEENQDTNIEKKGVQYKYKGNKLHINTY